MVETPLRRSRRIRSGQSDDEESVISSTPSRRSRRASNVPSSPATPTRRSTRTRTPRTAKGEKSAIKKEMKTIPESIVATLDVAAFATPAKSAKKQNVAKGVSVTEQVKIKVAEEETAESQSATPIKSPKTKKKGSEKKVDKTEVEATGSDGKASTPKKPANRRSKKENTVSPSTSIAKVIVGDGEVNDAVVTLPAKSPKTKIADPGKMETSGEETTKSQGITPLSTPASTKRSARKKRRKKSLSEVADISSGTVSTPKQAGKFSEIYDAASPFEKQSRRETTPKLNTKKGNEVETNPEAISVLNYADAPIAAPATPATKKMNATECDSKETAQGKAETTKEGIMESNGATSPLAPVSTKSSKKKKKKCIDHAMDVDDAVKSPIKVFTPKSANKSSKIHGERKGSEQCEVGTTKEGTTDLQDDTALSRPLSSKKKRKKRNNQLVGAVGVADSSVKASTPKSAHKSPKIQNPVSPTNDQLHPRTPLKSGTKEEKEIEVAPKVGVDTGIADPLVLAKEKKDAREANSKGSEKGEAATSPLAPGSTKSSKKKRKKRNEQLMDAEEAAKSSAKAHTPKLANKSSKIQDAASPFNKQLHIGSQGVTSPLAPNSTKSSKKKKKKPNSQSMDANAAPNSSVKAYTPKSAKNSLKSQNDVSPTNEQLRPRTTLKSHIKEEKEMEMTPEKQNVKEGNRKVSEQCVEDTSKEKITEFQGATSPSTPVSAKSSKKKKKRRNKQLTSAVAAVVSTPNLVNASPSNNQPHERTCLKPDTEAEKDMEMILDVTVDTVIATPVMSAKRKQEAKEGKSKGSEQCEMEMTKEPTTEPQSAASPIEPVSTKSKKKKCNEQVMGAGEAANPSFKMSTPKSAQKSPKIRGTVSSSQEQLRRGKIFQSETKKLKETKMIPDGRVDMFVAVSAPLAKKEEDAKEGNQKGSKQGEEEMLKEGTVKSQRSTSPSTLVSTKRPSTKKYRKRDMKRTEGAVGTEEAAKTSVNVDTPKEGNGKGSEQGNSPMEPAPTKISKKKKRKCSKQPVDVEEAVNSFVKDSAVNKSAKPEHAASPTEASKSANNAFKRPQKSNPNAPETTSKMNLATKKVVKKTKKTNKNSTKKQISVHKKKQQSKNVRPASQKGSSKLSSQASLKPPSHPPTGSPPKLVMDMKVHRLRFLKLHQRSIMSMASTPFHLSPGSSDQRTYPPARLAISREGGSVELLSPQDRWVSVGDVPGVRGREVDALVWVCGRKGLQDESSGSEGVESPSLGSHEMHPTWQVDEQMHLFGCSRDGTIFELDFAKKCQKGVIGSGGGGVFCLSSMCSRGKGSGSGYFAAGCEDGTVKIYSVFGSNGGKTALGMPDLVATLPSAGDAILSLAWVPGQSGNDEGGMGGSVIFAGVADGTIRRYDCKTAIAIGPISTGTVLGQSSGSATTSYRWTSTLRMTVENRGLRESTKVWALKALSDGTVISGDSLGHVQIWDGMSGTMTQTFDHNESGADVLCLAVSEDENKIFASGVDSSVRCIQRQCVPATDAVDNSAENVMFDATPLRNWISSTSHRKHSHDVKALVICHKETSTNSKPLELLVSGSVDTRICTYVAKDFKSSRPKIWYNWPTLSPVSISRNQRLLAVTRDNRVDLFRLNSPEMVNPRKNMNPETRDESRCLVKTISIQSPFNLGCSVISDDGKFLAASDALSLYVFSLEVENDGGIFDIHPTKLSLPRECKYPGTALKFGARGSLICATSNGPINILQISPVSESDSSDKSSYKVSLVHVFKEHLMDWCVSSHHVPVVCLDLSSNGKWLAAGRFSSGKGAVHVFTLPTDEDGSYRHWWSVPKMDAPTTCIKFLGGGSVESSLAVGCSNNEFYIYNLDRRSLSHWSVDMGLPLLKSLPRELTSRSEPVARIVPNHVTPQQFILGSHGYFCVVDLDQPVPERSNMFPPDHLRAKRLQLLKEDDAVRSCPPPHKKSKHNRIRDASKNFTICLHYSEILFQDFIAGNEMVIVEEPWMSILEELPDALARRVYGT